ncbi:Auxin-induced protein X10A [Senna tora]|uniref:Auxin-induced protein X10A n=1 Tax=Senna tora TaxID=362788 RepID=A0A835CGW5_9FABA|nr:Auxin-induced protein X10A [Senna tora]
MKRRLVQLKYDMGITNVFIFSATQPFGTSTPFEAAENDDLVVPETVTLQRGSLSLISKLKVNGYLVGFSLRQRLMIDHIFTWSAVSFTMLYGPFKREVISKNTSSLQGIVRPPIGWSYPNSSSA